MDYLKETYDKKDIFIQDYSIKHYYKISYTDYKGRRKTDYFEPQNNDNYIMYDKEDRIRYVKDSELIKPESVNLTSKLFWRKLFNVNESAMFAFTK